MPKNLQSCFKTATWGQPSSYETVCYLNQRRLTESTLATIKMLYAAKSLQSCPTLCDPIDSSSSSSTIPGILQARTLEWVAISFSNAWKWKVKVKLLSRVWLLAPHGLQPTRLLHPWDFPGRSTGVGCHCILLWWCVKEAKIELICMYIWTSFYLHWSFKTNFFFI